MKVEVDLTEYGIKAPKWYDPINPHVINASGGSGGSNDVELTWSEYEALSEEEKMNGSNYFITDIGNPKSLTSKVLFDSTMSLNTTYNLNDSFSNYDYISFYIHMDTDVLGRSNIFTCQQILEAINSSYKRIQVDTLYTSGTYYSAEIEVTDNTIKPTYNGNNNWPITRFNLKIIGYRYERVVVPNQMVNYSTVEQRIGTWIDGKPLYQKTIEFKYSDLNTSGTIKYTPGINSSIISNLKETISIDCIFITNNYGPIPMGSKGYTTPNDTSIYIEVSKYYTCIGIITQGNISLQNEFNKLYVTVRYTKTTD